MTFRRRVTHPEASFCASRLGPDLSRPPARPARQGPVEWPRSGPCPRAVLRESVPPDEVTTTFRQIAELLVSLSVGHLSVSTRQKLMTNDLSVSAYAAGAGGFVYVGQPAYEVPEEPDLAEIFRIAEQAGIAWLQFDASGATVDGLALYRS